MCPRGLHLCLILQFFNNYAKMLPLFKFAAPILQDILFCLFCVFVFFLSFWGYLLEIMLSQVLLNRNYFCYVSLVMRA